MKNIETIESIGKQENQFKIIREATKNEIPSEILATLVEEIKNEEIENISAYNRFHNRHNRSR